MSLDGCLASWTPVNLWIWITCGWVSTTDWNVLKPGIQTNHIQSGTFRITRTYSILQSSILVPEIYLEITLQSTWYYERYNYEIL